MNGLTLLIILAVIVPPAIQLMQLDEELIKEEEHDNKMR